MSEDLDESGGIGFDLVDWNWSDLCHSLGEHFFQPSHSPGPIYGTPDTDRNDWVIQTTPFTCAIVAQEMVLHEFGINASEAQLTYEATAHGWLNDGGTPMEDMSQLLELHGIPAHAQYAGSVTDLVGELAHGHKVIVPLDASDIWDVPFWQQFLHAHRPDHAVVVTGVDLRDPEHPLVTINDSGDPKGDGKSYPLENFLNAWSDSGGFYAATDIAPDGLAQDPVFGPHFQSEIGMYMDTGFWKDFLLNLARTAAVEWVRESGVPWPNGDLDGGFGINPLSAMTEEQRNDLLLKI